MIAALELPVGTLVDDPTALPAPRPPLMKRMCARCELVLGWVVCAPAQHGQVSHGFCQPCVEAKLTELADFLANEVRAQA